MNRLVILSAVIAALSVSTFAAIPTETLSVWTVGDRDGLVGASGTLIDATSPMFFVGDPHPALMYNDYGVVKYAIPTALTGQTIFNASLNLRCIQFAPGLDGYVHVLLQKYTFDNSTVLNAEDYTTTQVQNIGVHSNSGGWSSWDVTSLLQSDINNGYEYSSYRAIAVVSPTDLTPVLIPNEENRACYINVGSAEQPNIYPQWGDLRPRLDVEYVPEPATLGLLALGSLFLTRRK